MIEGMTIEDGWHMMLKTIMNQGKMHKKDDASILEFIDGFRVFITPVDDYMRFCGCDTTQQFIKMVDAGAFDIDEDIVKGKMIVLLDDIFDSGATLKEVGQLLTQKGAKCIVPIVIAKTVGGTL